VNFAVVPAAGRGSRLGRGKALLRFGESVVLDTLVATLKRGGLPRILIVGARGDDALFEHCATKGLESVVNDRPERGMLSSIQSGLRALPGLASNGDAVVLCPVDFPGLGAETVATLLEAATASEHGIAVPRFRGRRGHPLVISGRFVDAVHALDPEIGLRALLDAHPHEQVEVADAGTRCDLDTWIDYQRLASPAAS